MHVYCAALLHFHNTDLLDVLHGPLEDLDVRPTLTTDLSGPEDGWWQRLFCLLKLLLWLNK